MSVRHHAHQPHMKSAPHRQQPHMEREREQSQTDIQQPQMVAAHANSGEAYQNQMIRQVPNPGQLYTYTEADYNNPLQNTAARPRANSNPKWRHKQMGPHGT